MKIYNIKIKKDKSTTSKKKQNFNNVVSKIQAKYNKKQ